MIFKFTLIAEHCYRVLVKTIKNVSCHHWVTENITIEGRCTEVKKE